MEDRGFHEVMEIVPRRQATRRTRALRWLAFAAGSALVGALIWMDQTGQWDLLTRYV